MISDQQSLFSANVRGACNVVVKLIRYTASISKLEMLNKWSISYTPTGSQIIHSEHFIFIHICIQNLLSPVCMSCKMKDSTFSVFYLYINFFHKAEGISSLLPQKSCQQPTINDSMNYFTEMQ